jgi:uncharacterized protein YpmB
MRSLFKIWLKKRKNILEVEVQDGVVEEQREEHVNLAEPKINICMRSLFKIWLKKGKNILEVEVQDGVVEDPREEHVNLAQPKIIIYKIFV